MTTNEVGNCSVRAKSSVSVAVKICDGVGLLHSQLQKRGRYDWLRCSGEGATTGSCLCGSRRSKVQGCSG